MTCFFKLPCRPCCAQRKALELAKHFEPQSFDAIVGKTLIDCFMTRTDAAGSIRQLMQQCHRVLKDHGCMMLLDKAGGCHMWGFNHIHSDFEPRSRSTSANRRGNKVEKVNRTTAGLR